MVRRSGESDEEVERRRSSALMGLIVILSLAIAGVMLVRGLDRQAQLENCFLAGRTNCLPIIVPATLTQ